MLIVLTISQTCSLLRPPCQLLPFIYKNKYKRYFPLCQPLFFPENVSAIPKRSPKERRTHIRGSLLRMYVHLFTSRYRLFYISLTVCYSASPLLFLRTAAATAPEPRRAAAPPNRELLSPVLAAFVTFFPFVFAAFALFPFWFCCPFPVP